MEGKIKVKDLYDHIVKHMTAEEALKKLLSSSILNYEKLKFSSPQESVHPELLIVMAALDLGWNIMVPDGPKGSTVKGFAVGTEEYLNALTSTTQP